MTCLVRLLQLVLATGGILVDVSVLRRNRFALLAMFRKCDLLLSRLVVIVFRTELGVSRQANCLVTVAGANLRLVREMSIVLNRCIRDVAGCLTVIN